MNVAKLHIFDLSIFCWRWLEDLSMEAVKNKTREYGANEKKTVVCKYAFLDD